jgi:hypothetical protein
MAALFESFGIESFGKRRRPGFWLLAHVAQLVEHILGKDEVTGSIPVVGSREARTSGSGKATERTR